jgi:hypothetical protein
LKREYEETRKKAAELLAVPKPIEETVVEELNQKHAAIHTSQFYILTEKPHQYYSSTDFFAFPKEYYGFCGVKKSF